MLDRGHQGPVSGSLSKRGTLSNASSQAARLETKIWPSGLIGTAVFRLPAGTTRSLSPICMMGRAEPHVLQKLRLCRVDGKLNCLTWSAPESHFKAAFVENRFAACAEPVSLRQCSQWQR